MMGPSQKIPQQEPYRAHRPASAPKVWFERNWKWFVPLVVVVFITFVAAFALLIVNFVFGFIKNSDVYREALLRAQNNPVIIERLGTPVKDGYFVTGNINISGSSGEADLAIPVHGPKGEATLYVEATRSRSVWNYEVLEVKFRDTGDRVGLLGRGL